MASVRLKQKIPGVPAGAAGCRVQEPGTHGYRWWKTADFRTARAQRTVRPRCGSPDFNGPAPPRLVTCELSRVVALVGETSAQQAAHAVHTRERKLVKSRKKRPSAPFAKKVENNTLRTPPPPPAARHVCGPTGEPAKEQPHQQPHEHHVALCT